MQQQEHVVPKHTPLQQVRLEVTLTVKLGASEQQWSEASSDDA